MMNEHDKHIKWFYQLGANRKDLAYEITTAFSDTEERIQDALILSFEHIERVFMFEALLESDAKDLDEFWSYLSSLIETTSYYICMALPLVRQIIEGQNLPLVHEVCLTEISKQKLDENLYKLCNTKEQRRIFNESYRLAVLVKRTAHKYNSLSNSEEMVAWSIEFLDCCNHLLAFYIGFKKNSSHRMY